MLSCGAMLHHLRVSLAAVGLQPNVHRLPNPVMEDHLAAIELTAARPKMMPFAWPRQSARAGPIGARTSLAAP